jgi:hypothetical protein
LVVKRKYGAVFQKLRSKVKKHFSHKNSLKDRARNFGHFVCFGEPCQWEIVKNGTRTRVQYHSNEIKSSFLYGSCSATYDYLVWIAEISCPISVEIAFPRLQSEIKVALFLFASRSFLANNLHFMINSPVTRDIISKI